MAQITYNFRAVGAESVQRAFQTIGTSAEQSANAATRAQRKTGAAAQREATTIASAARSSGNTVAREAEKAARAEIKAKEKALAYVQRLRTNYFLQEQRQQERHERTEAKRVERRLAAEQRARQAASKRQWGALGDDVKSVGKGLALSAGAAILATVGAATRDSMALQEKSNRISINARGSGEAYQDPTALRKQFEATAIATPGIKAIDVADAVQKYVSLTGDTKTALASQGTFATAASATGTDIGDIAEAAASLSKQFDITGIEDMRDALAALTAQGKAGAFELSDAAGQFQRLAAAGAAFGLDKGKVGARTLGGLTQIARQGTGSAEEATTSVTGMFAAFNSKQKQLKQAGVNVFDKSGKRRNIQDLLVETIGKVGGTNASKKAAGLNQIFGEQGGKAINPMLNTYNEAFQGATGTTAERQKVAMDALRASIVKATDAPGTWADVVEDAARAQQSASAQLTGAWEQVTAMAGDKLAPAITDLIGKLVSSGAVDQAISALGVFAAALGEVAQTLTDLGLIKPKTKTYDEKKADAEKKLASFDAQNDIKKAYADAEGMADGPERDAALAKAEAMEVERDKLTANIASAEDARWQGNTQRLTAEQFGSQYAALGTRGAATENIEASKLAQLYSAKERPNELMPSMWDESDAQRNLRRSYEGQLTYEDMQKPSGGAQPVDNGEAVSAMKDVATSAKEAAAALRDVKPQPTIFGG